MKTLLLRCWSHMVAFFVPFLLLGGVLIIWRVYPFGDRSILMADQFTQYLQFYHYFYDVLHGNGSLIYTWKAGMGLTFWGTFAYYLSSPISFSILLFERAHLPEAFVFMTLTKVGLSGLFMKIYIARLLQTNKLTELIFSTLYALTSFSIGYFFNLMWLDSVYLLPLVLLGIEHLLHRRYSLLVISLCILFISNFYMAYIVGVFTFLYFLAKSISSKDFAIKSFLRSLTAFIFCAVLAGGVSAFITVPTYLILKANTYGDKALHLAGLLHPAFGFFEFIAKLYNGSTQLLNMPNVFVGLLPLLLAPLYFMSSEIRSREKIVYFILLCVLFASFQIDGLNLIWHAFEKPSGYLQRFAFVFAFMLVFLAVRAYTVFEKKYIPALFKIYFTHMLMLMLLTKLTPELMSMEKAIYNLILLTLLVLILYTKAAVLKWQRVWVCVLLAIVSLDMGTNAYSHMKTLNSYAGYNIPRSYYDIIPPAFEQVVQEMNEKDKDFYRMNTNIGLSANDSLRYDYRGMSNFNTLGNGTLHAFMKEIGYSTTLGVRSLIQGNGILSSDSLFGFKYIITNQPINKHGYERVDCKEAVCLYENNNALPLGFMVDEKQFTLNHKDNVFVRQNQLLGGINEGSSFVPIQASSIRYNNLQARNEANILYVKKIDEGQEGSIELTFRLQGSKQFYTFLDAGKGFAGYGETTLYINGKPLGQYPTFHNEGILDLGAFTDETVTVKIVFSVAQTQLTEQLFYALDMPSFEKQVQELKGESLQIERLDDTAVSAKINADKAGVLFLSIPYDKGWHAKVDGKEIAVKQLGGFVGLDIDKGAHTVEMSYSLTGLKEGTIVTGLSFVAIAALAIFRRRRKMA